MRFQAIIPEFSELFEDVYIIGVGAFDVYGGLHGQASILVDKITNIYNIKMLVEPVPVVAPKFENAIYDILDSMAEAGVIPTAKKICWNN